ARFPADIVVSRLEILAAQGAAAGAAAFMHAILLRAQSSRKSGRGSFVTHVSTKLFVVAFSATLLHQIMRDV
ncbi:hypothetical protein, partial [Flavobacterium poyangense]|uniref:hypothetical protein n=1 Tax=Flavobacterium poyangense TaxID=2204302 RepID=UPI0014201D2F